MNVAPGRKAQALRIFARGNVDVRDSLLWSRVNGVVQWNGINEVLRLRHPGLTARIRHETCARIDLIPLPGETPNAPPEELMRRLPSGVHPLNRQHSSALFAMPSDVVVFSLQSAVLNSLVRHRRDGWLLMPDNPESWDGDSRQWLASECENVGLAPLEAIMARLEQLIGAVEEHVGAHVLVYNLSPAIPGEQIHSWLGAEDSLTLRARRFNLALTQLSLRMGFSIVDVERIAACGGTDRLKIDLVHLTAEGWQRIAEEVVRILEERGCFDSLGATT
jgi:hypothetical protein